VVTTRRCCDLPPRESVTSCDSRARQIISSCSSPQWSYDSVAYNLSRSCPQPLLERSLLPPSTAHQPSMLETVAATVWDKIMGHLMRINKPSRLHIPLLRCRYSISSCSSQGQKSEITKSHSTIPTNHLTKNKTSESYESTKIPSELRLLHNELVTTSRKFEILDPISSFGVLESKPLGKHT
jgi:hypothetical protein